MYVDKAVIGAACKWIIRYALVCIRTKLRVPFGWG
jgi:hypothetical protein